MLPGGELYEQEERFFSMAAARTEEDMAQWPQSLPSPLLKADGQLPLPKNVQNLTEKLQFLCNFTKN